MHFSSAHSSYNGRRDWTLLGHQRLAHSTSQLSRWSVGLVRAASMSQCAVVALSLDLMALVGWQKHDQFEALSCLCRTSVSHVQPSGDQCRHTCTDLY